MKKLWLFKKKEAKGKAVSYPWNWSGQIFLNFLKRDPRQLSIQDSNVNFLLGIQSIENVQSLEQQSFSLLSISRSFVNMRKLDIQFRDETIIFPNRSYLLKNFREWRNYETLKRDRAWSSSFCGTNGSSGNDGKRIAVLPARLHANLSRLWVPVSHWLISRCPCSDLAWTNLAEKEKRPQQTGTGKCWINFLPPDSRSIDELTISCH